MNNNSNNTNLKTEISRNMRIFYNKIAYPIITDFEKKRKILLKKQIIRLLIGIFATIIFFLNQHIFWVLFAIVCVLSVILNKNLIKIEFNNNYDVELKKRLFPKFLSIFGNFQWIQNIDYEKYSNICNKLKILPFSGIFSFEDLIKGEKEEITIDLLEVRSGLRCGLLPNLVQLLAIFVAIIFVFLIIVLFVFIPIMILGIKILTTISGILLVGVFLFILGLFVIEMFTTQSSQGILIKFKLPKNFKSNTFIYENSIKSKKLIFKHIKGYNEVFLEDTDFNKHYRVFSTDQIESRYLLTTTFIERFKYLKTTFNAKFQRLEVKDNELFIFLETQKDHFKMGTINQKAIYNNFCKLFDEFYSILTIIEQLKLNKKIGL